MADSTEIICASKFGLTMTIAGKRDQVAWHRVSAVNAGRARVAAGVDYWILVLALSVNTADQERVLMIAETDSAWLPLTTILPEVLPGAMPFETWAAEAVFSVVTVQVYNR